ncbi:MAG: MBL fold metallo-hydrolase [Lachnospiraceae bacterium]|nr:MBL fold metallo-hydrolase [Lachnospiraceae bacterium]
MVLELHYGNTNTYLIKSKDGYILFDTCWAGTLPLFYKALGEVHVKIEEISHLLISHFHPDHMGLAGQLSGLGIKTVIPEIQKDHIHDADNIFQKEKNHDYIPLDEKDIVYISLSESRSFLKDLGIDGEILSTPGHSDDSISLWLDEGTVLVGDLNPLYELELHRCTRIEKSWDLIFEKAKGFPAIKDIRILYGHARPGEKKISSDAEIYQLVKTIMKITDKGKTLEQISVKTKTDPQFVEDVIRMYLTHKDVGVQGILDRIEIKNR